jgi:hypothetical protein
MSDFHSKYFLMKPENFEESNLGLSVFQWIGTEDSEMQLFKLKATSLWSSKFTALRNEHEDRETKRPPLSTVGRACQ